MNTAAIILFILIGDEQQWQPQPERFQNVSTCVEFKADYLDRDWQQRRIKNLWRAPWDQLEKRAGFCCAIRHTGDTCKTVGSLVAANK